MSSTTTKKVYNMYERRQSIPIIYVRGTHYDVGYDVVGENELIELRIFLSVLKVSYQ